MTDFVDVWSELQKRVADLIEQAPPERWREKARVARDASDAAPEGSNERATNTAVWAMHDAAADVATLYHAHAGDLLVAFRDVLRVLLPLVDGPAPVGPRYACAYCDRSTTVDHRADCVWAAAKRLIDNHRRSTS